MNHGNYFFGGLSFRLCSHSYHIPLEDNLVKQVECGYTCNARSQLAMVKRLGQPETPPPPPLRNEVMDISTRSNISTAAAKEL